MATKTTTKTTTKKSDQAEARREPVTGDTPPEPGTVRLFDENEIHRLPEQNVETGNDAY